MQDVHSAELKCEVEETKMRTKNNLMANDTSVTATCKIGAVIASETTDDISARIPVWKRIFDIFCIAITLPCWLTLMVLVTLWIKAVSPGPIFFRQERIGYRRKKFMVLKFRSMQVNAETQIHERHFEQLIQENRPMTKLDNTGDPRVIPFGRFLRATGLDELPQIFNVIRGEMSLVGPRPCTTQEFRRYEPRHQLRVNAPPGLTGYWQVHGKNKTTFHEMIEMDIYYNENMSIVLDLEILMKTLPAIVTQVMETRTKSSLIINSNNTVVRSPHQ